MADSGSEAPPVVVSSAEETVADTPDKPSPSAEETAAAAVVEEAPSQAGETPDPSADATGPKVATTSENSKDTGHSKEKKVKARTGTVSWYFLLLVVCFDYSVICSFIKFRTVKLSSC